MVIRSPPGHATVRYSLTTETTDLMVPFQYQVLEGSLDFSLPLQPVFYIDRESGKRQRNVTVYNHYGFNVFVSSASLPDGMDQYFEIEKFKPSLLLANGTIIFTLVMRWSNPISALDGSGAMRTELLIHNNASGTPFRIPV